MDFELLPLISFVLITTFTPGPNNIASASMGLLYGYRRSVNFMAGVAAGFFLVMLACAFVSSTLLRHLPDVEPVLRVFGAGYILWLAFGVVRAGYGFNGQTGALLGFKNGFLLQAVNLKVMVYGLTLYSTFLSSLAGNLMLLAAFALSFAFTAFCSTSSWALGGAVIRKHLDRPKLRLVVNTCLAGLLVYCAYDLSGLGDFLI